MKKYIPSQFEKKWQKKWAEDNLYATDLADVGKKYYVLAELPYSSGDLHMGHWFTFALADVFARFKKMRGFNVIFPIGFDAFGLPAENAAIKHGIHPRDWTLSNVERMKEQFGTMGGVFDWDKSIITCLPEYYRWNQWIFLKMLERGLAHKGQLLSNWCSSCQTVLANENVEAGKCWRCGTEVVQKEVDQWFLKITEYADRLIWPESPDVSWPKSLRDAQNNWIGKSEGALINFQISNLKFKIAIFTTRPDTIFGATFLVVSPEYPLLADITSERSRKKVEEYVKRAKKKSELERKESLEKTGVFIGTYAVNPLNKKEIPIWVADYVLPGYGTGAIMAVPAHDSRDFEFAEKFGLEIAPVVDADVLGEGVMKNSGEFNGLSSSEARQKITDYIEAHHLGERKTIYHLHDWSISRQRYWGTPIPVIYCNKCGIVPVPEEDLPVELPYKVDYTPKGKAPLATAEEWVNVKCPKCGGDAKREVETMDTFVDSSWYFFRYLDPRNDKEIFDRAVVAAWMPVDIYFGGSEHNLGHTLYSRFFTKVFHDLNLIDFDEYSEKRINHGIILGPDGQKMSKSKGNVVNPDKEVKTYGADAIRTYLAFLGPIDIVAPWEPNGINGVYHFMERVWNLFEKVTDSELSKTDFYRMHKTIKKVGDDLDVVKFNTAVAALMEWLNYLSRKEKTTRREYETFLRLLAPFAPHMTEELWSMMSSRSIHQQPWPVFDKKYLDEDEVKVTVQVDGKVRDIMLIGSDMVNDSKVVENEAKKLPKIAKFLTGKEIKRTVYIPVKINQPNTALINFVTASK